MSLEIFVVVCLILFSAVLINLSYYMAIKNELKTWEGDMQKALLFADLPEDCWILVVEECISELRKRRI